MSRFLDCPYRGPAIPNLASARGTQAYVCSHPDVRGPCVIEGRKASLTSCMKCVLWKEPAETIAANLAANPPLDPQLFALPGPVCKRRAAPVPAKPAETLSEATVKELFGTDADPTLLGNHIAALTSALGFPPCGGCNKRKAWLNAAHTWLRGSAT